MLDAHKQFAEKPKIEGGIEELYAVLDTLPPKEREYFLSFVYLGLSALPRGGSRLSYEELKEKINGLLQAGFAERFVIVAILSWALSWYASRADRGKKEILLRRYNQTIDGATKDAEQGEISLMTKKNIIDLMTKSINNIDEDFERSEIAYESFCTKVILPLLRRDPL